LSNDDVKTFATPGTLLEATQKQVADLTTKANESREAVKEQTTKLAEVTPATGGSKEAKNQIATLSQTVEAATKQSNMLEKQVKSKCIQLGEARYDDGATAIRTYAQGKGLSGEALFKQLAGGATQIPVDAFVKLITSLEAMDPKIPAEHAKLLFNCIQPGGIKRSGLLRYVSVYYKVMKDIAYTDKLDVSDCKTTSKAEKNEVIELLEGPVTIGLESSQMTRIRGKCISTNVEGWITVSGNQGSKFLEACKKPYYVCKREVDMAAEVGGKVLRKVAVGEMLEVLDGPKDVEQPDIQRAKVKTVKDKMPGWVTLTDEKGTAFTKEGGEKKLVVIKQVELTKTIGAGTAAHRTLEVDEELELIDTKTVKIPKVVAIQVKADDDAIGWVAVKDSKGPLVASV